MKPQPLFLLLMAVSGTGLAQKAAPVSLNLQQSLITTVKEGEKSVEKLVPNPASVLPGALLSQVVTARNLTTKSLNGLIIKLPVPKGTVYVGPESQLNMAGIRAEYSIDGGKTFAVAPLKRRVTVVEGGKSVTREVTVSPSEYNAVRWNISTLAGGATTKVGFRIKVP